MRPIVPLSEKSHDPCSRGKIRLPGPESSAIGDRRLRFENGGMTGGGIWRNRRAAACTKWTALQQSEVVGILRLKGTDQDLEVRQTAQTGETRIFQEERP